MIKPHQCGPDCICPAHKIPLYYSRQFEAHACQDPGCKYAHPGDVREPDADSEEVRFVADLAGQLVLLIHSWRERAGFMAPEHGAEAYGLCADQLEAVLRSAT